MSDSVNTQTVKVAPGEAQDEKLSPKAAVETVASGEDRFFLVLAIFIGIFAGLAVVCFRITIEWTRILVLGSGVVPTGARLIIAPAVAGFAVAILVAKVFPTVRGSGVNQTKSALYIYNGYISLRTGIGKFITSAIVIGSGHSLGPEDPSLQIGASIASALGRRLRLSRERLRLVAPIGAAAGLAAAFNAPISAVLFVIEEVIGRWSAGILGAVVLAAISSVVIARAFLGSEPMFRVPAVSFIRPAELIAYAVLGIAGAVASLVFGKLIGFLRPRLKAAPRWTFYLQPAVAGLLIGAIGYFGAPQVMGAGYTFIDQAMHNQFTWEMLGVLAGLKILATTLSFVSGMPGGMFAPTLFIGAMLGGAVGGVEHHFFHNLTGSIATYALVGMGVMFAGFLRAPMTSVFMVLEVSGNYSIIVPVLIANTLAYLISRSVQPVPIFDMLTRQDGIELPSMEEQREEPVLRVEDAMRTYAGPIIEGDEFVEEAIARTRNTNEPAILVRHTPTAWSVIGRQELAAAIQSGHAHETVSAAFPHHAVPMVFPDTPLQDALYPLGDLPLLPILHRANFRELQGVLSLELILRSYRGLAVRES